MKRKMFFFGLISAMLVMFLAGCPGTTNSEDPPVDKKDLITAIADAKDLKDGVGIDTRSPDQVPVRIKYVTQSQMDNFNATITMAETVRALGSATQAEVTTAKNNLLAAIAAFDEDIQEGEKDEFTTTELATMITYAETKRDSVQAGAQDAFAPGTPYVSADAKTGLDEYIDAAIAVRDDPPSQDAVNGAAIDLAIAISIFDGQIKTDGTKKTGITAAELTTLIATANGAKQGVVTSANGADVDPDVFWVTSAAMTALTDAINAAGSATAATRDAQHAALTAAIATFNGAKHLGTKPAPKAGSITFTGIDSQYNGQYASFRSSGNTEPTGEGDYLLGGSISSTGITGVLISNGSVTIPVQLVDSNTYTGGPYTGNDKNIRIYLHIKSSPSFAFNDLWNDDYEKYTIPFVNFTDGSASTGVGDILSGALTVTGGLSDNFMVYIVTTTITNSNLTAVMETPVAGGWGNDSSAELEWSPGAGNGTYSVIIMSEAGGGSVKYQNNVTFANGSGTVNWGAMTTPDYAVLSVGTLTFTGGSPGEGWEVLIVNGPLTGNGWDALDAMDAYVAAAPGMPNSNGSGWLIFTIGAPGETFNRDGTYSIIYEGDDKELQYLNNVKFTNGNATINLSSLIDFDFDSNEGAGPIDDPSGKDPEGGDDNPGGGKDPGGEEQGGDDNPVGTDPGGEAKTVTITGLSDFNGAEIQVGLFKDKSIAVDEQPPVVGMGTIASGRVEMSLAYSSNRSPWAETGDWYVGFQILEGESNYVVYITEDPKSFAGNNVSVTLLECEKMDLGESAGDDGTKPGEDGPGGEPAPAGKMIGIAGLSDFNGAEIQVGLFAEQPTGPAETSVFGFGSVQGDSARVSLWDAYNEGGPWTGTGNWYVGLAIGRGGSMVAAYVTTTAISFSSDNVTVTLDMFEEADLEGYDPGGDGGGYVEPEPVDPPGGSGGGGISPLGNARSIFKFAR